MKKTFLKYPFLILALILLISASCKPKAAAASTSKPEVKPAAANEKPKTTGKVSHEYVAMGCGTVVIVPNPIGGDPQILIPSPKLGDFDVDGQTISFHWRPLKMMNPKGCTKGSPAELTDIIKQ